MMCSILRHVTVPVGSSRTLLGLYVEYCRVGFHPSSPSVDLIHRIPICHWQELDIPFGTSDFYVRQVKSFS